MGWPTGVEPSASTFTASRAILLHYGHSGEYGTRTHNRFTGTYVPGRPLTIRLLSGITYLLSWKVQNADSVRANNQVGQMITDQ